MIRFLKIFLKKNIIKLIKLEDYKKDWKKTWKNLNFESFILKNGNGLF